MAALNKEYNIVIKLYTIAKDFDLPVEPEEYALYQTLSPSFQHLKTVILYAEAKKEDNIRKFSHSLDRLIREIKLNIGTMKNRVSDPMLLS
ncbi:hypothetical protein NP493_153g04005 [Ridgeia piscesae]|uniref:Uncharacterized protein n=1 Tax=Ridgeia piscesae TaxID=27915 RepID=A0AAD9P465_RIDPI|nr:hypothetical protein NP493_153g04005 [Ridgeia piscesae]